MVFTACKWRNYSHTKIQLIFWRRASRTRTTIEDRIVILLIASPIKSGREWTIGLKLNGSPIKDDFQGDFTAGQFQPENNRKSCLTSLESDGRTTRRRSGQTNPSERKAPFEPVSKSGFFVRLRNANQKTSSMRMTERDNCCSLSVCRETSSVVRPIVEKSPL